MVETLGFDALEIYCQNGRLDTECARRVKESKFAQPDGDEESGDEDGDDALAASDGESD